MAMGRWEIRFGRGQGRRWADRRTGSSAGGDERMARTCRFLY